MFTSNDKTRDLCEAFLQLQSVEECENFLRDLMTIGEIDTMSERWEVAQLVQQGVSYRKISEQTGASTATITRVAQWLHHGMGGYTMIIERKNEKK